MILGSKPRIALGVAMLLIGAAAAIKLIEVFSLLLLVVIAFWPLWWAICLGLATVATLTLLLTAYFLLTARIMGWLIRRR